MPSADFCAAIRRPFDLLSRLSDTAQTSRGKTNSLPHPPPNLRSAFLVNMDFVVDRPLVRRSRLISGSCSSVHAFAPRFLQTPPRDDALALRYPFTSTRLGRGLSPPSCRSCPAHDPSARSPGSLGRDDRFEVFASGSTDNRSLITDLRKLSLIAAPERCPCCCISGAEADSDAGWGTGSETGKAHLLRVGFLRLERSESLLTSGVNETKPS